ncbi:MAG: hypothetical protein JKY63_04805 [Rhodobiaceae bacterium]|nr:hypothetical protein [Rhodobiaceae bacterium]
MAEVLANENEKFGYRFVPLVTKDNALKCHLDILFLRPDEPGHVLKSGDIDNRLKTLVDGLRLPQSETEMTGIPKPADNENPFYCLLEDDSLISGISVETDMLLDEDARDDANKVRLVIAVEIKPYHVTMNNLSFA